MYFQLNVSIKENIKLIAGFFFPSQMLLCTGSFFGTSQESEKEWETYMSGSSSGGAFYSIHY